MASITKQLLASSVSGRQILVTSLTAISANTIHITPSGTSFLDEIWMYAYNGGTSDETITLLWGPNALSSIQPGVEMKMSIPYQSGRILIVDGKLLQNSLSVYSYATASSSISIDGFVNRYTY